MNILFYEQNDIQMDSWFYNTCIFKNVIINYIISLREQLKFLRAKCYFHRLGCWNLVSTQLAMEVGLLSANCYKEKRCVCGITSRWLAASHYLPLRIISVKLMLNSSHRKFFMFALDPGNWSTFSAFKQDCP